MGHGHDSLKPLWPSLARVLFARIEVRACALWRARLSAGGPARCAHLGQNGFAFALPKLISGATPHE
jgi:hypothetical protein